MNRSQRLYDLGARKIVVVNVGPIGCIPFERDTNKGAGDCCVDLPNEMARLFNARLRDLVSELGSSLDGSNLVYADVYRIVEDIIENYSTYGEMLLSDARAFSVSVFQENVLEKKFNQISTKAENSND